MAVHRKESETKDYKLYRAVRKYGWENITISILKEFRVDGSTDKAELGKLLSKLEIEYIKEYDSFKNGYNSTAGGEGNNGYHESEETKRKISEAKKGKPIPKKWRTIV